MSLSILDDLKTCGVRVKKLVFTDRCDRAFPYSKVTVRPFEAKGALRWQLEQQKDAQVFHRNLDFEELESWIADEAIGAFRQAVLTAAGESIHYTIFPDKIKRKSSANSLTQSAPASHNREKQYLLHEGDNIPALVDLGVFTKNFRIVKSKYDKFRQINRFLALLDDAFAQSGKTDLTILDFGCGKSYLTFLVYHYFTVIRKMHVTVIGYDLKADVVENCNRIAARYGYTDLHFYVSDVATDALERGKIDLILTLHACDTATDYALLHAIREGVPHIFSVPCCQHEINAQIHPGGDFDLLLRHGLFKERFSALLTDAIRAEVLRQCGYEVDVLEFVDFAHSPKNVMLRCALKKPKKPDLEAVRALLEAYGVRQTLVEALFEEES